MPLVGIVMGSVSDMPAMEPCCKIFCKSGRIFPAGSGNQNLVSGFYHIIFGNSFINCSK